MDYMVYAPQDGQKEVLVKNLLLKIILLYSKHEFLVVNI